MISIQQADFDHAEEYYKLRESSDGDGAIITFTGLVRDHNNEGSVSSLYLEHYPGMAEKSLMNICSEARRKWPLGQVRIIHRVGHLSKNEQIVFVGVSSAHRDAAFTAAQFIMDHLKSEVPLWKKEGTSAGSSWVQAKESDKQALKCWQTKI
ncbi:MAG: molybdopterin synthase catalytic subunit [Paraglaciecola sp.]|jgi:molybdopterin synthase catalytic subunit